MLQALISVAARFLTDVPGIDANLRESIAQHMAFAHQSVSSESARCEARGFNRFWVAKVLEPLCTRFHWDLKFDRFLETVKRYVYVTPKSYLELIAFYKTLLATKRHELDADRQRLESGVEKIAQASQQVAELQVCRV